MRLYEDIFSCKHHRYTFVKIPNNEIMRLERFLAVLIVFNNLRRFGWLQTSSACCHSTDALKSEERSFFPTCVCWSLLIANPDLLLCWLTTEEHHRPSDLYSYRTGLQNHTRVGNPVHGSIAEESKADWDAGFCRNQIILEILKTLMN